MLGEADADAIYVYEITDRPGARLFVGIPKGQKRPALWMVQGDQSVVLGRFNGRREMMACVNFLDTLTGAVNRAIDHYKRLNGDSSNDIAY